jgi:predicted ATPase
MLLIVDNFEQVLAAASEIATVLAASPRVTLLATSREALRVRGEQVIAVRPLPLPVNDHVADVEELAGVPAVALFVERARARRADFALTTTNAADTAAFIASVICVELTSMLNSSSKWQTRQVNRCRWDQ